MGAERSTPFAEDKLFQIVGYRYEERLPTIITTSQQIEAIASARPASGRTGATRFFATVADLLDYLRATFAPDSAVNHDDLLDRIRNADVLVLDDMGAERSTPFAEDKLFQIVGYRYEERLPTIITTSQQIEAIASARPRIASRLQDPLVVTEMPVEAPDFRRGGLQH